MASLQSGSGDVRRVLELQRWVNYIIIFIILIAAGLISGLILMRLAFTTQEVSVPDILGRDSLLALKTLNDAGLNMVIVGQEHSFTVPKNHVISQQPDAGRKAKKRKRIRVVVSLGSRKVVAPRLVGLSLREAKIALSEKGLFPERVIVVHDGGNPTDTVIAQNPAPGQEVQMAGEIDLLISGGKGSDSYIMPDIIGRDFKEISRLLEEMGVGTGAVEYGEYKGFPPGVVIKQEPKAGHKVIRGSKVALTLSSEVKGSSPFTGSFTVFRYRLPEGGSPGRVKIVVENEAEVRELFNGVREPGSDVEVMIKIEGETIARVYLDDMLVFEKRF